MGWRSTVGQVAGAGMPWAGCVWWGPVRVSCKVYCTAESGGAEPGAVVRLSGLYAAPRATRAAF